MPTEKQIFQNAQKAVDLEIKCQRCEVMQIIFKPDCPYRKDGACIYRKPTEGMDNK